jgi:hypothetical protein
VSAAAVHKDKRGGFAEGRQLPENTERSLSVIAGRQSAPIGLEIFLATVDDVIVVTGKSGPTTRRRARQALKFMIIDRKRWRSLCRATIGFFLAMRLSRFGDSRGVRGENA